MKPPAARTDPQPVVHHGDTRVDPYAWLRERANPDVLRYLKAENRYAAAMLKHTRPLQKTLYREILGRILQTDLSVPMRRDDFFYYVRTEKGRQYPIYCRKRGSLDAPEEVLLDCNELAEGHGYFQLGGFSVSSGHTLLAYSTDTKGDETFLIRVKNLATGKLLPVKIPNASYAMDWANDNRTFFYTVLDKAKRAYQVWRHTLDDGRNTLIYHEKDERFSVSIQKTRSRRFLLLETSSEITSEVRYLDADRPRGRFRIMLPRIQGVEYGVSHQGGYFYIRTNQDAKTFRLMRTPDHAPSRDNWEEYIACRPRVNLDAVEPFRDYLVVWEREKGLQRLRVMRTRDRKSHHITFPEPAYALLAGGNAEFNTNLLRFGYSSLVTPVSVYDYNLDSRERELKKRQPVLGGYDPQQYKSERINVRASDGVEVPVSLVYRKGTPRNGTAPMLLTGYGSYGASDDPAFSSDRLSLLDRGFVYAIAHVRGGGELGKPWHDAGKLLNKKNTFTDFVASARMLIRRKSTSAKRLVIMGGSAGGLLIGAVLNRNPELFKAAVAEVPFVDVLNTMLDPTLPLTVSEYEEWGNPAEKEYYDYIKSYSPYDNVASREYPAVLVTAGLNDPRVAYWEPAKWVARLRTLKKDRNALLLKTTLGGGHFGVSGRYEHIKETAFLYAFVLDAVGVKR